MENILSRIQLKHTTWKTYIQ